MDPVEPSEAAETSPLFRAEAAPELSVVIPCLNESRTIGGVVERVRRALDGVGVAYEVVVSDNGSTDGAQAAAEAAGARVFDSSARRGYGGASRAGADAARGRWIVFLDADGEHAPEELPKFVAALREGAPLVLGSRVKGGFLPGSNPFLNRAIGTPLLTWALNHYIGTRVTDCNTGYRAMTRATFDRLALRSDGMELSTEIIARAGLLGIDIAEVPVVQHPAPPGRVPHLRRFRDGWRHLKFILLHAPDRALLRPGLACLALGLLAVVPQIPGPIQLGSYTMDLHLMILGALLLFIAVEMIGSAILAATIAGEPVAPPGRLSRRLGRYFVLDRVLPIAGLLFAAGLLCDLAILVISARHGFRLNHPRLALLGTLGMGLAVQLSVLSFVHSVIESHGGAGR